MPVITHRVRGIREDIEEEYLKNFDFKMGDIEGYIVYLVADEDVEFVAGEVKPVRVHPVKIRRNTLTSSCPYARHGVGHVLSVGQKKPGLVERDRYVDTVLFIAGVDGIVSEGDLIGVIKAFPIEPLD